MIRSIFEWACFAAGGLGLVGVGWGLCRIRLERQAEAEIAARKAASLPPEPDLDGAPPFTEPGPDDDDDEGTAAWLASLHNGFMDAYRADERLVRDWIACGCIGPMPEAPSWDEDELVLRGLILSRAEMLELEAESEREFHGAAELVTAQ